MRFFVSGNVPRDFLEFMVRMEGESSRTESLEDADVVLSGDADFKPPPNTVEVLFEESKASILKNAVKIAEVALHRNYFTPLWAFIKASVEGKTSLVSRSWARKVVSGILQGMITLMEVEDEEGYSHSQRVASLAVRFGSYLGLEEEDLERLKEHAMLHDVGKIGIEQLMLYSPTRIRLFENLPQDHTVLGSIYLSTIEFLWDVIPTVRYHHERWDGKGFPDGLKGYEIPYFARIVSICDYYDNLTHFVTAEWEGGPKTPEEALKMIEEESGKMFDPELVDKFVRMMREGHGVDKEG